MAEPLRWGIMGTGNIARQFAAGVASSKRSRIVAVGSRSHDSASAMAKPLGKVSAYGSYDELLSDPEVQAVYVSLPNSMHHEWTLKALRAGKHVLCEKPIASTAGQAKEMFDAAQKAQRVLVEAFMYRSHPRTQAILATVASGAIGQIKLIKTSFCFRINRIQNNIRFDPALAGGAAMDIGCYCVSLARLVAGQEPDQIQAVGRLHSSGVDEAVSGTLRFPNGIIASFVCGMLVQADNTASVCGSDGYLEIPWPWKPPRVAKYVVAHSTPTRQDAGPGAAPVRPPHEEFTVQADAELYGLEADDFAAAALDGAPPRVTRDDSVGNMRVLDEIRRQIGLSF